MDDNPPSGKRAFTVLEMLVLIATLAVVVALILPMMVRPKVNSIRIHCVNNLKQVGLAFRLWSGDHNERFPMQFYTNESEKLKFPDATNVFRYFIVMSNELNELSMPKILTCPADDRLPAADFTQLANTNISYFIGLDASETNPTSFLVGDRNVTGGTAAKNGILMLTTNRPSTWTRGIHNGVGNIALADGSVQQLTSAGLLEALIRTGLSTNRLAMPLVPYGR